MYISHIKVKGFRNFKDSDIEFNDGLNVLIRGSQVQALLGPRTAAVGLYDKAPA